jgi:hypothetical protein
MFFLNFENIINAGSDLNIFNFSENSCFDFQINLFSKFA